MFAKCCLYIAINKNRIFSLVLILSLAYFACDYLLRTWKEAKINFQNENCRLCRIAIFNLYKRASWIQLLFVLRRTWIDFTRILGIRIRHRSTSPMNQPQVRLKILYRNFFPCNLFSERLPKQLWFVFNTCKCMFLRRIGGAHWKKPAHQATARVNDQSKLHKTKTVCFIDWRRNPETWQWRSKQIATTRQKITN